MCLALLEEAGRIYIYIYVQRGVLDEALVEGGGRRDKQKDTRAEGQEQWWCGCVSGPSQKMTFIK